MSPASNAARCRCVRSKPGNGPRSPFTALWTPQMVRRQWVPSPRLHRHWKCGQCGDLASPIIPTITLSLLPPRNPPHQTVLHHELMTRRLMTQCPLRRSPSFRPMDTLHKQHMELRAGQACRQAVQKQPRPPIRSRCSRKLSEYPRVLLAACTSILSGIIQLHQLIFTQQMIRR